MIVKHADVTQAVIGLFYQVYNVLGYGFLEGVYSNAMALAGRKLGLEILREVPICVRFEGSIVGKYYADMVVNHAVIAEVKACRSLAEEHEAQLLNYLKATEFEVGLLLNFGPRAQIKRLVYDNEKKGGMSWCNTDAHGFTRKNTDKNR